jgi:hypothetical protein
VTVLRLDPLSGGLVDRALAAVDTVTLVRRPDGAYADVADAYAAPLVRALALGGVRAEVCAADMTIPRALLPALGRDLGPLPRGVIAWDRVRVRPLALGDATRELLRQPRSRWSAIRIDPTEGARALLRSEDAMVAWARHAWATRDALRTRAVRASLRPVIFDRTATLRADLPGRTLASAGAITRWLFG